MNPRKAQAFELYSQGFTPAEVREKLPDLPTSTVYAYKKLWKEQAGENPINRPLELLDGGAEGDASTEIRWLKRELRKRIQQAQAKADPRAISQLGNTYLRAIELENSLKIDEPEESQILEPEERLKRINELIALAKHRKSESAIAQPEDQPNEQ